MWATVACLKIFSRWQRPQNAGHDRLAAWGSSAKTKRSGWRGSTASFRTPAACSTVLPGRWFFPADSEPVICYRMEPDRSLTASDLPPKSKHTTVKALLIRPPWIDMILDGKKTWELRGSRTTAHGVIALIAAGSKHIVGTARLSDVVGPSPSPSSGADHLTAFLRLGADLRRPRRYAKASRTVTAVRRLPRPVRYKHPSGAVIWVNLPPRLSHMVRAAGQQRRRPGPARRIRRT